MMGASFKSLQVGFVRVSQSRESISEKNVTFWRDLGFRVRWSWCVWCLPKHFFEDSTRSIHQGLLLEIDEELEVSREAKAARQQSTTSYQVCTFCGQILQQDKKCSTSTLYYTVDKCG